MDFEQIISSYKAAYKRAVVRGEMAKAEFYGKRITAWIQVMERGGMLEDGRMTAFAIGKAR